MAKQHSMTSAQPSMLKSAVTLWMKVTDPESAAMTGWPAVPLALFIATHLASLGVAYIGIAWDGRPWAGGGLAVFEALCRADCGAVLRVAQDGYPTAATATQLPVFPLLVAGLKLTGLPGAVAAWLLATLASLGALLFVHRVFQRLEGDGAALWGTALVALFPFAVFQHAGHGDALAVLATAVALWWAFSGKYLRAGAILAVAVLVQPFAAWALGAVIALQVRDRGWAKLLRSREVLGVVAPIAVLAAWSIFLQVRFGDAFAYLGTAEGARPTTERILSAIYDARPDGALTSAVVLGILVTIGAVMLVLRRPWLPLLAFALPFTIAMWTVGTGGLGRLSAAAWPAFLPLGVWMAKRPTLQVALVAASAIFFGVFVLLYAQRFPLG